MCSSACFPHACWRISLLVTTISPEAEGRIQPAPPLTSFSCTVSTLISSALSKIKSHPGWASRNCHSKSAGLRCPLRASFTCSGGAPSSRARSRSFAVTVSVSTAGIHHAGLPIWAVSSARRKATVLLPVPPRPTSTWMCLSGLSTRAFRHASTSARPRTCSGSHPVGARSAVSAAQAMLRTGRHDGHLHRGIGGQGRVLSSGSCLHCPSTRRYDHPSNSRCGSNRRPD